jgi:16S rRNA (adenine1518-N6/adenine1519-N6)-dimethyltransferase
MSSVLKELKEYGLSPKKRLGQHFLIDRNILNKILRLARIGKEDTIVEIGPGLGEMTLGLSQLAKKVIAIEIDSHLAVRLREKFAHTPNVEIIEGDILKMNFSSLLHREAPSLRVVANLPYQISTPLLFRLIEERGRFRDLHLMMQKEVAQRLIAPPGKREYSPLSVFTQMVSIPTILFFVKPSAFFPPPKVDSALVRIEWRKKALLEIEKEDWFKRVVKGCLGYRRKTLINALKYSGLSLPEDLERRLKDAKIDPDRRPDTLTPQEFVNLSELLKN